MKFVAERMPSVPNPKQNAITSSDMLEFVNSKSDFAFEMRVLKSLVSCGFFCKHSGSYHDPFTNKIRQFDIRAVRIHNDFNLSLAVECKNVRPNFPLLISAAPRRNDEAFHHQIVCDKRQLSLSVRKTGWAYRHGEMVGKLSDQVGRDQNGVFGNDRDTFDKLTQAVTSAHDLIVDSSAQEPFIRVVLPVLVVPDGTLWQVDYGEDGAMSYPPRQVEKSSMYLGYEHSFGREHSFVANHGLIQLKYVLTHLELVTNGALPNVIEDWFKGPRDMFSD